MNGPHDYGGLHGYGPVLQEADEPNFHADWEETVFGLTLAMGATGLWNIDASRFARESIPPAQYISSSYYQIWLEGLIKILRKHDLVSAQELAGAPPEVRVKVNRILAARDVEKVLASGGSAKRDADIQLGFAIGDRVRVLNRHPETHTRMPHYVRGHIGVIADIHGAFVFPDTNARGEGEQPGICYGIRFEATELWGEDADPHHAVYLDLWEAYLEPA